MWPHGVQVSVCMPPDTDTPQLAFENQYKPAETKAIAGNVKTLEPDAVARSMADGMARGRFEIYPDVGSRVSAIAQGVIPGVVRWACDSARGRPGRRWGERGSDGRAVVRDTGRPPGPHSVSARPAGA